MTTSDDTTAGTPPVISYPRQEAATRRFRLGQPRAFRVAAERITFIRSSSGRDPVGSLWEATPEGDALVERKVVDAHTLVRVDGDLPEAEKARRERMRETTSGITAYSGDHDLRRVVFALDGVPYLVDLESGSQARELPHPGPVVDPQLSPDGRWVSFVSDRALHVVDTHTGWDSPVRTLRTPASDEETWGLADFVAAEELDRYRGLWWLPSSDALLVEFVDESAVEIRWIADPSQPEQRPRPHRYPAAGTANPVVRLFLVRLDGSGFEIDWDHDAFPYLATVHADDPRAAIISVLSRDQRTQSILRLDAGDGAARIVKTRMTEPWITMCGGVPGLAADGALLEIIADDETDCFRLVADDHPVSPAGLNIGSVVDASDDRIVVIGTSDPQQQHVLAIHRDGTVEDLTEGETVNSAFGGSAGLAFATTDGLVPGVRFRVALPGLSAPIASLAERPVIDPVVAFHRVGRRQLSAAVLWPTGHVAGSERLPVVMAPYGGPHHARVVRSAGAFAADQWLADQGFAVVVVDGRGTPGRGPAWEFEVYQDLATKVLDDQVDALRALAEIYPDLDLDRVGITGWSFGGYLAALAVLDRPDVFHAAVAGAPVTDWRLYDTAYSERYLGLPQENATTYDATSLLTRADTLSRPLLIIHGLADDNVLVANTLQLSSALLAAGREHFVLPLSRVTHMTPQEEVAENLLRLEVDFLRRHLQTAPPGSIGVSGPAS
jgi:dipeptidyl-peptidase-4